MTNEVDVDEVREVEGVLEYPRVRQKQFTSTVQLAKWLLNFQPRVFQVQPTRDGQLVLTWEV